MANSIDMTGGGHLTRKIIMFALPLMASGIVQQSFNSVDVAVVGHFVGAHALAAVGANGPVIGLIVNLFIGISIGANVVIANYLGQQNQRDVGRAVHTAAVIALTGGILLLLLGLTIAGPMLEMLDTPEEIIGDASIYLRIYALGFPGMLVYNFASAILRSVGDTRRPFYWLVIGGIINVCLNMFFVIVLGMGVSGVAIATVVANYISAAGVTAVLIRDRGHVQLHVRQIRVWRTQLDKILKIGVPAGVQGMVFSISNVFIQSAINGFGAAAIAGSAAAINYEMYCYFVLSAFVQAVVAFMSQNYGAGNYDRCRKVYWRCLLMGAGTCATLNLLIAFFWQPCVSLFTSNPEAAHYAMERIFSVLVFQSIASSYEVSGGALRALGYSMTPTVITILGTCVVRVGWVWTAHFTSFENLLHVYPVTWTLTGIAVLIAWFHVASKRLRSTIR